MRDFSREAHLTKPAHYEKVFGRVSVLTDSLLTPPHILLTRSFVPSFSSKSFPHSSVGNQYACNAGDLGLIPGSGRSPGEGNGNPLQNSSLENPVGRGAWRATVHGATDSTRPLLHPVFSSLHPSHSDWVLLDYTPENTLCSRLEQISPCFPLARDHRARLTGESCSAPLANS